ncbi:MAG: PAS domain-containing protein [Acidobacteriota bacterium]|nr:PAS domain-containing protein [Acidobacteriota bacterium]
MENNRSDSLRPGGAVPEDAATAKQAALVAGPAGSNQSFHRQLNLSFVLLAAFQLLLIGISVLGWLQFQNSYLQTMKTEQIWHERRQKITELETFASLTTMPGMEDFHSGDWVDDRESMNRAARSFMTKADAFAQELANSKDAPSQSMLPTVRALSGQMQATLDESDKAFAAFSAHQENQFEAETFYTDRIYRRVLISVADLRQNAYDFEANDLKEQALAAGRMRVRSFALVVTFSLLALILVAYARSLHRRLRVDEERLKQQRAALEARVEESTAELQEGVMKLLHAQSAMQKIESRIAEGQRLAHFGDWEWDVRSGGMSWSDETYRLLGREAQSQTASLEAFLQSVSPEERDGLRQAFQQSAANRVPLHAECRVATDDGGERILLMQGISGDGQDWSDSIAGFVLEINGGKAL